MINTPDIQQISAALAGYSNELAQCIQGQLWEELLEVLVQRQSYFDGLDDHTEALKAAGLGDVIRQMIMEDDVLISDILLQKEKLAHDRLALVRARQAVKAYE